MAKRKVDEEMKDVEVRFYYHGNEIIDNIFGVCIFIKDKTIISRGVSICSLNDNFNKKLAREISYKRCRSAFGKGMSSCKINKSTFDRSNSVVTRRLRVNDENVESMIDTINELDGFVINDIKNGNKRYLTYELWYSYPTDIANSFFEFKSEYMPEPTSREIEQFIYNLMVP